MYAENSDLELIPANKEGSLISQEPALARTVASFNASHIPPASLDRRDRPCALKACGACFDVVGWVLQVDFSLPSETTHASSLAFHTPNPGLLSCEEIDLGTSFGGQVETF